jgi:membrane-bound lytic murein transglycosylase B
LKRTLIIIALFSALMLGIAQTGSGAHQASQPPKPPQNNVSAQKTSQKPAQQTTKKPAQGQTKKPAAKASLVVFPQNPDVVEFIAQMVVKHQFDVNVLALQFSKISPNQRVINLINPKSPPPAEQSWKRYSSNFLGESRISGGVRFWTENSDALQRAYEEYGVPPEVVVAIIGVETIYGQHTGGFGVMEALASLGFYSPRRGEFFRKELEHFLILARKNGFDPLKIEGSYAGAIGIPQFMPSSWLKYAVDFDGDGTVDLTGSATDSIGSVASYLNAHGWQKNAPIAHRVAFSGEPKESWLTAGMLPSLSVKELSAQGVRVAQDAPETATLIQLPTPNMPTEYWLGYKNYYAITRYNRSTFYSMSVFLLAERLRERMGR